MLQLDHAPHRKLRGLVGAGRIVSRAAAACSDDTANGPSNVSNRSKGATSSLSASESISMHAS